MKILVFLLLILMSLGINSQAQINRYSKPTQNSLQRNDPNLLQTQLLIIAAEEAKQRKIALSYKEYYSSIQAFKPVYDGIYKAVIIFEDSYKGECLATIYEGRVIKIHLSKVYDSKDGLFVNSKVHNAHNKFFLELKGEMVPVDIYLPELFN